MAVESKLSAPLGPAANERDAEKLRFIDELTANADAVQEKVLAEILSRNTETEYLKRYELDGATDRATFKSKVPVVTYEDLQPEIQRIANGDRSPILCSHPISEFLTSSGTSAGERKLMPTIQEELERRQLLYSLLIPVMNLYVPDLDKGKGLYFLFVKSESKTPGGLPARPVLTSYYKSDKFRTRPHEPFLVYTSPTPAILCVDSYQSMYVQMLCGLYQRLEVLRVGAVFASGLCRAIRFLQLNWSDLVRDLESGTLSPKITDTSVRESVCDILKPDPDLANFITEQCSGENWAGIITRIWPNTKYLDVIVTGAMAQYIPTLEFYSGGLPMACTMYASSECYFGLNLKPMCKPSEVSYTIMPNMAYFEFIPHNGPSAEKAFPGTDLVDLAHVEAGKEYELVITTYAGLNRYRVGDILRVTGFHNAAPQFKFVRRKNVLLSIESDKTDEAELQKAVECASELLKPYDAAVAEYTSQGEKAMAKSRSGALFYLLISLFLLVSPTIAITDGPFVVAHKKVSLERQKSGMERVTVSIDIYNQGSATAYDVSLSDDSWGHDRFDVISGSTSKTWERLDAGATVSHSFVLDSQAKGLFYGSPAVIKFRVPTKAALQEAFSTPVQPLDILADKPPEKKFEWAKRLLGKYGSLVSVLGLVGLFIYVVASPSKSSTAKSKKKR